MKLSIISAIAANKAIGYKGKLIYHIKDDMIRFKELTMGHPVIMGRLTFESLPKILPGRRNIVISSSMNQTDGVDVVRSLEEALELCSGEEEVFVIGGHSIYKQALPLADTLYLTEINDLPKNYDTVFPSFSKYFYKMTSERRIKDGLIYDFATYKKLSVL